MSEESFVGHIWNIWVAGRWTMSALCVLSLLLYGSAIRMFLYFSRRGFHRVPRSLWSEWIRNPEAGEGEIGEIIRYTQDEVKSVNEVHSRFAEVAASKIPFMDRNINYINILVAAAPLIGLLGTVMGMLMTFQSIGLGGGETAEMMAKGISAALFPPEVGLCVALPGLLMVHLLKRKRNEYEAFLARLESFTVRRYKSRNGYVEPEPVASTHPAFVPQSVELEPSPVTG